MRDAASRLPVILCDLSVSDFAAHFQSALPSLAVPCADAVKCRMGLVWWGLRFKEQSEGDAKPMNTAFPS